MRQNVIQLPSSNSGDGTLKCVHLVTSLFNLYSPRYKPSSSLSQNISSDAQEQLGGEGSESGRQRSSQSRVVANVRLQNLPPRSEVSPTHPQMSFCISERAANCLFFRFNPRALLCCCSHIRTHSKMILNNREKDTEAVYGVKLKFMSISQPPVAIGLLPNAALLTMSNR